MDHRSDSERVPGSDRSPNKASFKEEPYEVRELASKIGERVRTARIRRRKSQDDLARACGVGRSTIFRLEQGDLGIASGKLLAVLWALGLLGSAAAIADPDADQHGKILEAARRPKRVRAEKIDNDF